MGLELLRLYRRLKVVFGLTRGEACEKVEVEERHWLLLGVLGFFRGGFVVIVEERIVRFLHVPWGHKTCVYSLGHLTVCLKGVLVRDVDSREVVLHVLLLHLLLLLIAYLTLVELVELRILDTAGCFQRIWISQLASSLLLLHLFLNSSLLNFIQITHAERL